MLGKSFPLKAREHPKEKACAVREFVQGELEKARLSKCDCEYPDNVQACFCVSSSLRTVMRVLRVGRCGRLNDMKRFLLCVESELLASGGAFFFLTGRLQTVARGYSVAFLVVALAHGASGLFGNSLSRAHVRAASQSCYICHGAEHVSI